LSGAAPVGVADLLRKGGLLYSERPAGLLRNPGRFTPKNAKYLTQLDSVDNFLHCIIYT